MRRDVTRCPICISNEVENFDEEQLQKIYQRSYNVILSDLCNVINKMLDKISCHTVMNLHQYSLKFTIL